MSLPINEEDSVSLIKLNKHLKSPEFKTIFNEANKFKLINIIRIDDYDNSYPNRIKVHIECDGEEKTLIYKGINEDEEIIYNTMEEFVENVKYGYGNTYVFVITVTKIWADKNKETNIELYYGITFKVNKVFIIK